MRAENCYQTKSLKQAYIKWGWGHPEKNATSIMSLASGPWVGTTRP